MSAGGQDVADADLLPSGLPTLGGSPRSDCRQQNENSNFGVVGEQQQIAETLAALRWRCPRAPGIFTKECHDFMVPTTEQAGTPMAVRNGIGSPFRLA